MATKSKHKIIFKLLVVGDSCVGKSSLLQRFSKNTFGTLYNATIGAAFITKTLTYNDKTITLQLWDTAGQERYFSLGSLYYRGADAIIFVHDLTDTESLNNLEKWYKDFLYKTNKPLCSYMIVGNKSDLIKTDSEFKIKYPEWITKNNLTNTTIVSAKTNENVDLMFDNLIQQMIEKYDQDNITSIMNVKSFDYLPDIMPQSRNKCCFQ